MAKSNQTKRWLNKYDVPQAQDGTEIDNLTQEGLDAIQSIYRNNGPSTMLGKLPFNIGSAIGIIQSHANNQPANLSDEIGLIPNPYAQAASYVMLAAEKEKENLQKYGDNRYKGKDLTELIPTKEVNNTEIDNTFVPKPKIGKLKTTKQTKEVKEKEVKQIPYKKSNQYNNTEIDNTYTSKPRINDKVKTESKLKSSSALGTPLTKFVTPLNNINTDSFVIPEEFNNTEIDNTRTIKPKNFFKKENGGIIENYNDSNAFASPDVVGDGFSNVGRNSSPAWGGAFQDGGKLKFLQPTDKNLPEGYVIPYNTPSTERAMSIGGEDGEPAYLIPSFKYGKPLGDPIEEFRNSREHLGGPFKTWQEADKWENETRHPAVENRETIMFPQKEFAMGGSIPGTVGFTYARTKGIPSEGKYAKKTLPSAQDGRDIHGTPMYAKENYVEGLERSNYDPRLNRMNLGEDYNTWADKGRLKAHENYHAIQHAEGRDNFDIGHNTENRQWAEMQKRPELMSTDDTWNNFYNRKNIETNIDVNREAQNFPEAQFFPQAAGNIIANKIVDQKQYDTPDSLEGEAQRYEYTGEKFQNGGEMRYYQNGLDFQPKTISKNGAWLSKYEQAQGGKKIKLKDERLEAIRPSESTLLKKPNFELEQSKLNKTYIRQASEQKQEDARRKKLTKAQREREDYNARNEQTGSVQTPVEESTWDRTKAIVSNPLTAFGYAARNESLPTRFQHGERNTLDNAIDWVNPLQGVAAVSEIPGELGRGEFLNAGLSALDAADLGVYAKGAMKASKPFLQKAEKVVSANKLNFKSFKPNPEAYYRKIGNEGYADALESGVIRAKQQSQVLSPKKGVIDISENFQFKDPYFSKGSPSETYKGKYMVEATDVPMQERSGQPYSSFTPKNELQLSNPNLKVYKKHWLQGYKEVPKQKNGGVIKDDRGQWDHPGEITEIGSNQITMQGVPYPVLGISDTGDTQMMYPEEEYEFDGEKVTEYPMARNGIRQEQKGLQNLEDLTNFTNYNKPTNWLNKYN